MTDAGTAPSKTLLIAANKVDEMVVRSRDGDKIGHVHTYMVNKRSGSVTHAVLSLGGSLASIKAIILSRSSSSAISRLMTYML